MDTPRNWEQGGRSPGRPLGGRICRRGAGAAATALLLAGPAAGQGDSFSKSGPVSVLIEEPAPLRSLFERAGEGAARGDWKLAIDSLQRIIDEPGGALFPVGGPSPDGQDRRAVPRVYESARRAAMARLAQLPPEGLASYRTLYDGAAKRLFESGVRAHDVEAVRTLVERYLLTSYGDDGADLLASWALDEGRPGEALRVLADLARAALAHGEADRYLVAKRCAALMLLGRRDEAAALAAAAAREGGPDDGEWAAKLLAALRSGGAPDSQGRRDAAAAGWPMLGGGPQRTGRMPATTPTLTQHPLWTWPLPGGRADAWRLLRQGEPEGEGLIPARQAALFDGVLAVRTDDGCLALEAEGMTLLWHARRAEEGIFQRRVRRSSRSADAAGPAETLREDGVSGDLAAGGGLVVVVDDDADAALVADSVFLRRGGFFGRWPGMETPEVRPNRLIAYDGRSGRLRWTLGSGQLLDDPGRTASFRAAPIFADGALWTTYLEGRDIHLVKIDAAGRVAGRTLIGSLDGWPEPSGLAQGLAAADGLVVAPTGFGLIVAVDARTLAPRWATEYAGGGQTGARERARWRDGWLSSPPIVAGGRVIYGPADGRDLLCLDAGTGEVAWRLRGDGDQYAIAADGESVWVGGGAIQRVILASGAPAWTTPVRGAPTGRAVLSGPRILVPTTLGLAALNAFTGEETEFQALSGGDEPPGNLVCADGAMFSVEPGQIRKFPDFTWTAPEGAAADGEGREVLRRAWLEMLRGRPEAALELLDSVDPAGAGANGDGDASATSMAHLRVRAMLAAAAAEPERPAALEQARRAIEAAHSDNDRLEAALVHADLLARRGRTAEACRALWDAGLSPAADPVAEGAGPAAGSGGGGPVRHQIARRLADWTGRLSDVEMAATEAYALARVREGADGNGDPAAGEARRRLAAAAQIGGRTRPALEALMALAVQAAQEFRLEAAEQHLLELTRRDPEGAHGAAAWMRLADLHRIDGFGDAAMLRRCREALSARASMAIPPDYDGDRRSAATVGEWAERALAAAGPVGVDAFGEDLTFRGEKPTGKLFATDFYGSPLTERMLFLPDGEAAGADGELVFYAVGDVLRCRGIVSGEIHWETPLRVFPSLDEGERSRAAGQHRRRAAVDGSTLIVSNADGLHAVGLRTGKRLWSREYDWALDAEDVALRDRALAAGDGVVAASPRNGAVALLAAADGRTLWETDLGGQAAGDIRLLEGRVLACDHRLESVTLLDQTSGARLASVQFRQPDSKGKLADIVTTGGLLCGPDFDERSDYVVAYDVDTGERRWQADLGGRPLVHLFKPADGLVGVGLLGGGLRVLDGRTGATLLDAHVPGAQSVTDGVVLGDALLVAHAVRADVGVVPHLALLDSASGRLLWRRDDVIPVSALSGSRAEPAVRAPVVMQLVDEEDGGPAGVALAVLDRPTGQIVDRPVMLLPDKARENLTGDFAWRRGGFAAGTTRGILFYPLGTSGRRGEGERG